jgi:4-oxalocrotonate tautomerase
MPLVTVKGIEGVLTPEQKRQLIKKLTDVMVEFDGGKLRLSTSVIIEDVKPGDSGIAGNPPGLEEVRAAQSGAAAITEAIGATWCA